MLKATLAAATLFSVCLPTAFADIRQVDQIVIVRTTGSPILKKVQEEDFPSCMTTRYTFGDTAFDLKHEFKCDRANVAWTGSQEP